MQPRPLAFLAVLVSVATLAAGGSARAQDVSASDAQRLFQDAKALADAGDCKRALPLFHQSNALHPARGPLYNIALCEEKLGKVASAWKHFRELLPDLPPGDPRIDPTTKHLQALDPRVPFVRIHLAADAPSGARITLDGMELSTADVAKPVALDPGDHTLLVAAPGRGDKGYVLTVQEGKQRTLTVEPGEAGAPPAPALPAQTDATPERVEPRASAPADTSSAAGGGTPRSTMRTAGFVSIGLGAAGVAASFLLGGIALAKKGDVPSVCSTSEATASACKGPEGQVTGLTSPATASFVAGLGLAALGIGLVVGAPAETTSVAVAPAWRPGEGGMVVHVRF